jgi:hypothetical protein
VETFSLLLVDVDGNREKGNHPVHALEIAARFSRLQHDDSSVETSFETPFNGRFMRVPGVGNAQDSLVLRTNEPDV